MTAAIIEGERKCSHCPAMFTPAPAATGRNRYRCKKCNASAAANYRASNAETVKRTEARRAKNPTRAANVAHWSRITKLKQYGLTPAQYDAIHAAQSGLCAICFQPETSAASRPNPRLQARKIRRLAVDHNHQTGEVRGLLCVACNTAIGALGEDPERIRRILDYLDRNGALTP